MQPDKTPAAFVESLRPPGSKRSTKRDRIVDVFLSQDGHLTADDLVDLIRKEDQQISRATVYRTLAWMEAAGIARKVDFGEGRFRYEHSYRHPRHFHLICKSCNQQMEFLSSDIEQLIEEVAEARRFSVGQAVVQLYGTCHACATGERPSEQRYPTDALFARDALHVAIATEKSGREFYTRAASMTKDPRARSIFERLSTDEDDHLERLEGRYRQLLADHPGIEDEPQFLFFKGAANGLFSAGVDALRNITSDKDALMLGIRCERGSHRFFKRYGEKFEDSEGKRVFLQFADEERDHLELLIREYRILQRKDSDRGRAGARA